MLQSVIMSDNTLNMVEDIENSQLLCQLKMEVEDETKEGEQNIEKETEANLKSEVIPLESVDMPVTDNDTCEIKEEQHGDPLAATDDESMAAEALRQLGGMFVGTCTAQHISSQGFGLQVHSPSELANHHVGCHQTLNHTHICNVCGESFERKTDLENHIVCHQVDRPHACRICGNLFLKESDLSNHMAGHHSLRPYRCHHCGADFQRCSSLTNHLKIHSYVPGRALFLNNDSATIRTNNAQPASPSNVLPDHSSTVSDKVSVVQQPVYDNWKIGCEYSNISANVESSLMEEPSQNLNESNEAVVPNGDQIQTEPNVIDICSIKKETFNHSVSDKDLDSEDDIKQDIAISIKAHSYSDADNHSSVDIKMREEPQEDVDNASLPVETMLDIRENGQEDAVVVNSENGLRPHVCYHCGTGFSRFSAMQSHLRLHEDSWGGMHECHKCGVAFPEDYPLRAHELMCKGRYRLVMPPIAAISKPTAGQSARKSHISASADHVYEPKQTVKKHMCTECGKRFTTKQKLFRHMWIHRKKRYVCDTCKLSFDRQASLDEHRHLLHPDATPFTCRECGRSFASRQGLWEHGRSHGSASKTTFWCNKCDKNFASRQGYVIHIRVHTGERPYGCPFCWKAFRDSGTLRKHERIHTGERPHVCPLCQRAFNQKVVLREHIRWVHVASKKDMMQDSRDSYPCRLCVEVLGDKDELCAHIVKHSDQLAVIAKSKAKANNIKIEQHIVPVRETKTKKKVTKIKNKTIIQAEIVEQSIVPVSEIKTYKKSPIENKSNIKRIVIDKNPLLGSETKTKKKVTKTKIKVKIKKNPIEHTGIPSKRIKNTKKVTQVNKSCKSTKGKLAQTKNGEHPSPLLKDSVPSFSVYNDPPLSEPVKSLIEYTQRCDMCGNSFLTRSELLKHILIHI